MLWLLIFGETFNRIHAIPTGNVSYLDFLAPGILALCVLSTSLVALHLAWCEWAWATSYAPRSAPSLSTKPPPDQLSLFT